MKMVQMVIPVFNEEENVVEISMAVRDIFSTLPYEFEIIFVDDGSADNTLENIKILAHNDDRIKYISFSKNFGHQAALKAGIDFSDTGDCIISMDGDMQHPAELIPKMLQRWEAGYDIVYSVRKKDPSIPRIKKILSDGFYKFINRISDTKIIAGAADFRLLSQQVATEVRALKEYDLFLRGLVHWTGFKQIAIEYVPGRRHHGYSKYNLKKMMALAINGITSFSDKPLYLAAYLGCTFSILSLLYLPYAIGSYFFGYTISGWTSIIVTIAFFGGLQLMILGIVGIYIGKIFMQSKNRPVYITRESNVLCTRKVAETSY